MIEQRKNELLALLDDRQSRPRSWPDSQFQVIRTAALAGKPTTPAAIAEARQRMLAPVKLPVQLPQEFMGLAGLGFFDDAFRLADQWSRTPLSAFNQPQAVFAPDGAALRRDPRFIALAARIGLVDYWRSTGKWPDFCAEPDLPYDCKAAAAKVGAASRN